MPPDNDAPTTGINAPVNVATKRTAINLGVLVAAFGLVCKVFGIGWRIEVDDLLPLAPVFGVVAGIGYRLSRAVADKWPTVGYVLFGSKKTPIAYIDTTAKES